ncbi:hypothetical protein [Alkaliphilus serpentinus]|uniref:hypothetical protein n=1 Tax=Alkaliphilus serpentinus TaxID=1482731 RepID=UPI0018657582|nr:hypothetical protein [Alkaliphilus serpentinus]
MKFKELNITRFHWLSLIYIFTLVLIAGTSNYYTWSPGTVENINLLVLLGWIALYVPLLVSHKYDLGK